MLVKGGRTLREPQCSGEAGWACLPRPLGTARALASSEGCCVVPASLPQCCWGLRTRAGLGAGVAVGRQVRMAGLGARPWKWREVNSGHTWKVESTLADQPDVRFGRKRGEGNARRFKPEPQEAGVTPLKWRLHESRSWTSEAGRTYWRPQRRLGTGFGGAELGGGNGSLGVTGGALDRMTWVRGMCPRVRGRMPGERWALGVRASGRTCLEGEIWWLSGRGDDT